MQTHAGQLWFRFDLLTSWSVHAEIPPCTIMSTDFGAASSSRFLLRVRTNTQTRLNVLPHADGYNTAGVGNNIINTHEINK